MASALVECQRPAIAAAGFTYGRRSVTTRFLVEDLGISVHSLQRQLGAESLSVRQLMREHRAELAAGVSDVA
ncbi:hypothetical protein [Martelella mediterranea]|uniref:Uncharacterized protein n=1 Tax=Martelella mediterranea DSM 17316 TaxID=1122214 RepID=A0A1U9Z091_9HYPH|nr:hypothetical protein [Martelella mediterranea]AQZ51060.1 hypothetical protein Mame_01713 [Martelella mediterranea DSM 17316]